MGNHIGLRRGRNEDRVAVGRIQTNNSELYTVALVCDGVGGSESGDRAATLAIAAILGELGSLRIRQPLPELAAYVVRCADDAVRRVLNGRGTTTLCMFLASNSGSAVCISVGDSRAYSWRPGAYVNQVSVDDTVENELKALPGDHEGLINAKGLKDRLSQAIGESDRTADELSIQIHSKADFQSGVLLGSDGMWKVAKDYEAVMLNSRNASEAVRRGITLANWVGGVDNASLIAIEDLGKFCGIPGDKGILNQQTSLSLWVGLSKFRFLSGPRPQFVEVRKPEKKKRWPVKISKKTNAEVLPPQMELQVEKSHSTELRPVLEVTIRPKEKKEN